MNDQNTVANSGSKDWRNWVILVLRWLGGAFLGYTVSFFLFLLNESGNLPFLWLVISGQEELFEFAFFYVLYDKLRSTELTSNMALFVYTSFWALIGALLMSARRKQIRLGVIFLILYLIVGFLSYVIFAIIMIPT